MSTELKDSQDLMGYGPHRIDSVLDGTRINIIVVNQNNSDEEQMGSFYTPDFIAAVETELNGIFISRAALPEVISGKYDSELAVLDSNGEKSTMAVKADTPESLREIGLAFLAMASYREKNPPFAVDEEQVEALTKAFMDAGMRISTTDGVIVQDYARRLIATGKITVRTV